MRWSARRLASTFLAFGPMGLAMACGSEDITVATIPGPDGGLMPCRVVSDGGPGDGGGGAGACPAGQFCQTATCSSTTGTCQNEPVACSVPALPVCGCDNVTYVDECLANQAGMNIQSSGQCTTSQGGCDPALTCPDGSTCVFIVDTDLSGVIASFPSSFCPTPPPGLGGKCWGIPATCPTSGPAPYRAICGTDMPCLSACQAVKASGYYDTPASCP